MKYTASIELDSAYSPGEALLAVSNLIREPDTNLVIGKIRLRAANAGEWDYTFGVKDITTANEAEKISASWPKPHWWNR